MFTDPKRPWYVYIKCKPDGTPFYVGKGKGRRANSVCGRNVFYMRVLNKYGKENIKTQFEYFETESAAFAREIELIAVLRRVGVKLANATDGGEGMSGHKPRKETIEKRKLTRAGKKWNFEQRLRLSEARKRLFLEKPHLLKLMSDKFKGVKMSAERYAKHCQKQKEVVSRPEYKIKMSQTISGRTLTPQHCAAIAEEHKRSFTPDRLKKLEQGKQAYWKKWREEKNLDISELVSK